MGRQPPPPPEDAMEPDPAAPDPAEHDGFGRMTRAWLDAGSDIAEYEAGRRSERRRILFATIGVFLLLGVGAAVVVLVL